MIKKAVYLEPAPAKINLFLDVGAKRDDGFHELETVFQAINLRDFLTFEILVECGESEDIEFEISLDSSDEQVSALSVNNSVVKAIELFFANLSMDVMDKVIKVEISVFIDKNIPMEAGLAGGSSNAAAALRVLNRFTEENFDIAFSQRELIDLAAQLGSDVPFCLNALEKARVYGESRGEKLLTLEQAKQNKHTKASKLLSYNYSALPCVLLVKPNFGVPTAKAYELLDECPALATKEGYFNSFEPAVFAEYPELDILQEKLKSICAPAPVLMSGSGSTMMVFFSNTRDADKYYKKFRCDNFFENMYISTAKFIQ